MLRPNGQSRSARSLLHPLAGGRLTDLVRTLGRHGGFSPRATLQVAIMLVGGLGRWPFYTVETFRVRRRVSTVEFQPPVFIVGHWRSGTTFLHNLLSLDARFIYPTAKDALRPFEFYPSPFDFISRTLLKWSLPAIRPMDNVPLGLDLPQEDELALATMGAPSFFNCFYFPGRLRDIFEREVMLAGDASDAALSRWRWAVTYYLGKLQALHPEGRLLVKNPAHSARIRYLRNLFPTAKFIHIHRHPVIVHQSTCKLYRRMIDVASLRGDCPPDIDIHVLNAYKRLSATLMRDLDELPKQHRIELRYDDLVRNPVRQIERIYDHFEIERYDDMAGRISRSAGMGVPNDRSTIDAASGDRLAHELAPFVDRLGYSVDISREKGVA